jgi:hypothetical protein
MNSGRTVFSQLMDFLPLHEFRKCVRRHHGEHKVRRFTCLDQFLTMAFAQLTFRESLRDTETCLRAMGHKLYHSGFRGRVSRSTLADANEHRDWHIFEDFAHILIDIARPLYAGETFGIELDHAAYVIDSTTIDLCLALFPWARFRKHKAAVKLHTLLDLRGSIPCVIRVTDGKTHDLNFLDSIALEPGAFYIMDRGYIDFERLHRIHQARAFFVVRSKKNLACKTLSCRAVDKSTGLRSDHIIQLTGPLTSQYYPVPLRRVHCFDAETENRIVVLTNHFDLDALTVAQLYKARWSIELFFKWMKQHLRIKTFFGTSPNAVKTQVWIAISIYVLVAIVKKQLKLERPLSEILQILSISLFEKVDMCQALTTKASQNAESESHNQLLLFN